ncbi:MAG: virulence RhuM family protein [Desulfosporosinus sp.]|nr:virulence RhuM family protein [Desulfosporosinus sp.]
MYPADVLWRIYANDDRGLCQPFSWLSCEQKNRIVQKGGNRELRRDVLVYNLDAIISVGYRVNSLRATQFRQWATGVLRTFAIMAEARCSEYQRHTLNILNRIMTIKKKPAELLKSSGFLPYLIRPRLKHRGYSILCYGRPGCYIVKLCFVQLLGSS